MIRLLSSLGFVVVYINHNVYGTRNIEYLESFTLYAVDFCLAMRKPLTIIILEIMVPNLRHVHTTLLLSDVEVNHFDIPWAHYLAMDIAIRSHFPVLTAVSTKVVASSTLFVFSL